MAEKRVTFKLTQLRCLKESDSGPSEPYIWVTYFALGPQVPEFQTGPLATYTPSYDAFRTEFPDNVSAGSVVGIPSFISSAQFDMDVDAAFPPKLIGCVVVLMEEDSTRQGDIVRGRIAYTKEMEKQLNALATKRIQTGDTGPLTDDEIEAIKSAVRSKVEDAVASEQSAWDLFRDQDDNIGFTYKIFPETSGGTIGAQTFDFPDISKFKTYNLPGGFDPVSVLTDRYVLSGEIVVEPVPGGVSDPCAGKRNAVEAKQKEIASLHRRVRLLQLMLQTATPQQKAGIINQINATEDLIAEAEALLPRLQKALQLCLSVGGPIDSGEVVVVNPGG